MSLGDARWKKVVAKLRQQVQNMQIKIDTISKTLNHENDYPAAAGHRVALFARLGETNVESRRPKTRPRRTDFSLNWSPKRKA